MPNFVKVLFGSCLGTLLALGVLFFIGFTALASFASQGEDKPEIKANTVLTLDLESLPELSGNLPMDGFEFDLNDQGVLGLHDIVRVIEAAKEDDDIKGIYLNSMVQGGGFTQATNDPRGDRGLQKLREIRRQLRAVLRAEQFLPRQRRRRNIYGPTRRRGFPWLRG